MNEDQKKNIEGTIDSLCENLVWTWGYHQALFSMHTHARKSNNFTETYPQLTSCLYHGLFDALFLRLYHFIDSSKGASGFPYLFKIIRKYCHDDQTLIQLVSNHEKLFIKEKIIDKIRKWRNEVVAHLTQTQRDQSFYKDNQLHLTEIEHIILLFEEILEEYSHMLLKRFNDTKFPSEKLACEISEIVSKYYAEQVTEEGPPPSSAAP